jgi:hypothetical protein
VTTKGGRVPPQPARPTLRLAQAAGLTLYVVTLAILVGLFVTFAGKGLSSLQEGALLFSTAAAIVAVGGMGWDAVDLWLRGRRMTPYSVKMFRSLVFVSVLAALGSSFLARTTAPVLILAPSMIVYLFVARRPATGAASSARGGAASRGGGAARPGSPGPSRTRQRRGGKKHK